MFTVLYSKHFGHYSKQWNNKLLIHKERAMDIFRLSVGRILPTTKYETSTVITWHINCSTSSPSLLSNSTTISISSLRSRCSRGRMAVCREGILRLRCEDRQLGDNSNKGIWKK